MQICDSVILRLRASVLFLVQVSLVLVSMVAVLVLVLGAGVLVLVVACYNRVFFLHLFQKKIFGIRLFDYAAQAYINFMKCSIW